jgi:hypothetical protein
MIWREALHTEHTEMTHVLQLCNSCARVWRHEMVPPVFLDFVEQKSRACLAKTCTEQSSELLVLKLIKSDDVI